jgi:hypothetical protein
MTRIKSFSIPDNWTGLSDLLATMPREMGTSKTIKYAVDLALEKVTSKPRVSLDNFGEANIVTPDLRMTKKIFQDLVNTMNIVELRELQSKLSNRKAYIDELVYRKTQ